MIKVKMHLYKSDGVIPSCLCYFLVSILKWYTYTMATRDSPDICAHALGPQIPCGHCITITYVTQLCALVISSTQT